MRDDHQTTLEAAQCDEALFAVIATRIFECHALSGEHRLCVVEAEAVLRQILAALRFIPFEHGLGANCNYICDYI